MNIIHKSDKSERSKRPLLDTNDMIAALSHDLRSPTNTIIGFAEILLSDRIGKLNPEQRKQLNIILRNGSEQLKILDELIDYCRTLRDDLDSYPVVFALNPLMEACLEKRRAFLTEQGISLDYEPPETSYRVSGKEAQLSSAVDQVFEVGLSLFKSRKIIVKITEVESVNGSRPKPMLRVEIIFSGSGNVVPEALFVWDRATSIPAKHRFAMHVSRFYLTLMGGDLSVSRERGRLAFEFDLCKGEL